MYNYLFDQKYSKTQILWNIMTIKNISFSILIYFKV